MEYVKFGNLKSERPRTRNYDGLVSVRTVNVQSRLQNYWCLAGSAMCKGLWIYGSVSMAICVQATTSRALPGPTS